MEILIFGAGVLGSLYAARLQGVGHSVTILARGQRLNDIQSHGILLEDALTGVQTSTQVNVIEHLTPEEHYDLAVVVVRRNQLTSVLPALAANKRIPTILFMLNNAAGPQEMIDAVGRERVLLGFPGGGGQRDGALIRYQLAGKVQPTTLGEMDGFTSVRLKRIASAFREAGFPVAISRNIDAWLKTHVALVSPVANALYLAGGDNYRLAHTRDGLVLMVRAIREGLRVLRVSHIPITPVYYQLLEWIPEPILIGVLERSLATRSAELMLTRHANAARDEMLPIADEFRALARSTSVPTPAIDRLYEYIHPEKPAVPEGQASLPLQWGGMLLLAGLTAFGLASMWMLTRHPSGSHSGRCCGCQNSGCAKCCR